MILFQVQFCIELTSRLKSTVWDSLAVGLFKYACARRYDFCICLSLHSSLHIFFGGRRFVLDSWLVYMISAVFGGVGLLPEWLCLLKHC